MKGPSLILAFALTLSACAQGPALQQNPMQTPAQPSSGLDCRVASITDGDTVRLSCADGSRTSARLRGFDTPETYQPGCPSEYALGRKATATLRSLLRQAKTIRMTGHGRDKYGRLLVKLFIDGENVAKTMIAQGLAVPYRGGKRINWCARLS